MLRWSWVIQSVTSSDITFLKCFFSFTGNRQSTSLVDHMKSQHDNNRRFWVNFINQIICGQTVAEKTKNNRTANMIKLLRKSLSLQRISLRVSCHCTLLSFAICHKFPFLKDKPIHAAVWFVVREMTSYLLFD